MDVVANLEPLGAGSLSLANVSLEDILGVLDQFRVIVLVVISVQIEIGDVVTEVSHVLLATRLSSAAGVGRAHVGGDLANNVAESHLIFDHLVVTVLLGDGAEVQVGPCVGRKLVAGSIHALEDSDEFGSSIDLALVDIVTSDEEGSLGVV